MIEKTCWGQRFRAEGVSVNTGASTCVYDLQAATTSEMGEVIIEGCTSGIVITVSNIFATCVVDVPNQTIPSAVSYTDDGSDVKVKATATGVTANGITSSGLCPLTKGEHGNALGNGATYSGESEVSAAGTFLEWRAAPANVDLDLKAPTFHEGEELTIEAENSGNVEWTWFSETFRVEEGAWAINKGERCTPITRNPGQSCTLKVKYIKAGPWELEWTLKVESTRGATRQKTMKIKCDP